MTGIQVSGSVGAYQHLKRCIKGIGLHIYYPVEYILALQKNAYSIIRSGIFADGENKGISLQHLLQFLASGD